MVLNQIEIGSFSTGAIDPLIVLVSGGHTTVSAYGGNYWRIFGETEDITLENIEIVDYWLEDNHDPALVAQEIGEKWLPKLLELSDEHSLKIATKLIKLLYKVKFIEQEFNGKIDREAKLRFDNYIAKIPKSKASGILHTKYKRKKKFE